jgi:hypothetical protein
VHVQELLHGTFFVAAFYDLHRLKWTDGCVWQNNGKQRRRLFKYLSLENDSNN